MSNCGIYLRLFQEGGQFWSWFTCLIDEVGTLSYSRRLDILNLTTKAELRIRGDLIDAFKVISGLTDYRLGMFTFSGSRLNLVSSNRCSRSLTRSHFSRSLLFNIGILEQIPSGRQELCDSFRL